MTSSAPPLADTIDRGGIFGHPRGLTPLFLTEMWERFSYYGMRALLVLYMVKSAEDGGLNFDTKTAGSVYGNYTMSVYLLTILGGFIADNFIGARRAVFIGGIIIACGHFSMAIHSHVTFFAGLAAIAIGTGLLKPNISAMVGALYSPEDQRRDAGFSIFYMGINIGGLTAPLITGYLAQSEGWKAALASWGMEPKQSWHWGFAAAGVGMTLGLIIYFLQRDRLATVGDAPSLGSAGQSRPWGKLGVVTLASFALIAVMMQSDQHPSLVYLLFAVQIGAVLLFALKSDQESKRMAAILVFFIAAEVFWAIFEQAGSTITLFADRLTQNEVFGHSYPSAWWQSVNSVWVILLAPVFAYLWVRLGSKQPSSPTKFALGLLFLGLSFLLMVPAAQATANGAKAGPLWLVGLFFLQTVGEMLLSPVGLSTMTKLAPHRLAGLVMGIWFLAAALGNKLAGVISGEFTSENSQELARFFAHQALAVGVCTVALFALIPWMRRLMGGVR